MPTPSARGEAPLGHHPGNAAFNRTWTLLHVPCVNLPGPRGANGITLANGRFTDRQLLEAAAKALAPCLVS